MLSLRIIEGDWWTVQQYEKQLKKAQLTDKTIMLWNERCVRSQWDAVSLLLLHSAHASPDHLQRMWC